MEKYDDTFIVENGGTTEALVFEGALNGDMFKTYMEKCLAPTLKAGDIVVMDNLSSHKVQGLEEIVMERGAQIEYLPPYSPDFNPVENMCSKIKAHLCQLKERCKETLFEAVGTVLKAVTVKDGLNIVTIEHDIAKRYKRKEKNKCRSPLFSL